LGLAAIACSGSNSDAASSGQDIVAGGGSPPASSVPAQPAPPASTSATPPASLQATVDTKPLDIHTDICEATVKVPVVTVPGNDAATAAIADALKAESNPCAQASADFKLNVDDAFQVTANDNGFLSILVLGSSFVEGGAHPSVDARAYNFELATGKKLSLTNVLADSGKAKLVSACQSDPSIKDIAIPDCAFSINETPVEVPPPPPGSGDNGGFTNLENLALWVATDKGIHVEISVDHADGDFQPLVVPWATILSDITSAPLTAYAKAHP
jgi:hypothetical protein